MMKFVFTAELETPTQAQAIVHDIGAIIFCKLEDVKRHQDVFEYVSGARLELTEFHA